MAPTSNPEANDGPAAQPAHALGRDRRLERPHVIFVNRFFFPDESATSQILSDLAFALAADGFCVQVVTSRQRFDDPRASLPREEMANGVTIVRCPTTRFGRGRIVGRALDYLSFAAAMVFATWRLARRGTIIVAMTDPPMIGSAVAPLARLRGARLINWLQDVFPEVATVLGALPTGRRLLTWLRNRSLRSGAVNVAIGDMMAERVRRAAPKAALAVIPNWGLDSPTAPIRPEESASRREWKLGDRFVVGYSGNLGRAHEFETLFDAAQRLRERTDIILLIVGDGFHRASLERRAHDAGLANILFRPYQPRDRLADSLAAADAHLVCLLPELEGLIVPSKLYGILAAGRPVLFVGDPEGEVGRIVRSAGCGFAIRVGDGKALAAAIESIARNRQLCSDMAERALWLSRKTLSREHALGAWKQLLFDQARR